MGVVNFHGPAQQTTEVGELEQAGALLSRCSACHLVRTAAQAMRHRAKTVLMML